MSLFLTFENQTQTPFKFNYQPLLDRTNQLLDLSKSYQINFFLVENQTIKELNQQLRNKKQETDVLSVSYFSDNNNFFSVVERKLLIGEIFICPDYVAQQAKNLNQTFEQEMEFLFIHGLLHIFNFDHQNDEQEKEMNEMMRKILRKLDFL